MRSVFAAAATVAACAAVSGRAAAQASESDVSAAQALFDDAKKLMEAGKYDDACPKLVESQRLDPGGGTLLALGLCHEAQDKLASAWADFNLAISAARKDGRADREKVAAEHARALEPRLARLRVVVAQPAPPGLVVERDGATVGAAQWSTPLPVDAGEHRVAAHAPAKKAWERAVTVKDAATIDVEVPPLEDAPAEAAGAAAAPAPPPVTAPATATAPPPAAASPRDEGSGRTTRVWALGVGAVGVVLAGVGAGFGISAFSKWHDADRACPSGTCTKGSDVDLGKSAGRAADVSTVMFAGAGVAIAASAVLFVVAGSSGGSNVTVAPSAGALDGVVVRGAL